MTDDAEFVVTLEDESATLRAGEWLGGGIEPGRHLCISLQGELGAGKTTLSKGVLRGLGHRGNVKSPTYTLVEPYELEAATVYHFDLYRLADPEELEYMGIRDYFTNNSLSLVEWYERGAGVLPPPDVVLTLSVDGNGRRLRGKSLSEAGKNVLARMESERALHNG